MVEAVHFRPGTRVVASFTTEDSAVRTTPRHPLAKLPVVRILMAGGARFVCEVKRQDLVGALRHGRLVTLIAGHRGMSARQRELRLLMHCNREERALKTLHVVTVFAPVVMGRTGKLPIMCVLVALRAIRELHLVNSVPAGGGMALRALDGGMLALERIPGSLMFLHAKQRRLPILDSVTFRAFALQGTVRELAVVHILVAVGAIRESKRLLEFASGVASRAIHLCVSA